MYKIFMVETWNNNYILGNVWIIVPVTLLRTWHSSLMVIKFCWFILGCRVFSLTITFPFITITINLWQGLGALQSYYMSLVPNSKLSFHGTRVMRSCKSKNIGFRQQRGRESERECVSVMSTRWIILLEHFLIRPSVNVNL